jgi:hypothetical protein
LSELAGVDGEDNSYALENRSVAEMSMNASFMSTNDALVLMKGLDD